MNARTRAGLALAGVCLFSTPSCITAALWEDHHHGCGGSTQCHIAWRAALTPFTLLADALLIGVYVCGSCHGGGHCR